MAFTTILRSALFVLAAGAIAAVNGKEGEESKHVFLVSVDGLHASDVPKYVAQRPKSTFASLLKTGVRYPNALTSAPSDSFPGTMAQSTGAHPRTTGIWYDDAYTEFYPPGSNCTGPSGSETLYDESLDYDSTQLFSGGIDPAHLPRRLVNGQCQTIRPGQYLRVNTIWERVVANKGFTAYSDKHPAYLILSGPSGTGLTANLTSQSETYFPEIAAVPVTTADTINYDQLHVNAFLNWTAGMSITQPGKKLAQIPTLYGGNFQAVSVAQKTVGYANATGNPFSADILKALDFVDSSLGQVVDAMKKSGIYEDTLIVIASKHGQAPIQRSLFREIDPKTLQAAAGVPVDQLTSDDIGLFWLKNHGDAATAAKNLLAKKSQLQIQDVIYGQALIDQGFGNPATDRRVPDVIVRPELGVIYTTSNAKIAEHGGISKDDRNVALIVSNPKIKARVDYEPMCTRRIAPTVLKVLGINPEELQGVQRENTQPLPGF